MALRLTLSNDLRVLARELDQALPSDPLAAAFAGVEVAVDSPHVGKFLLDALAAARGIVVNARFPSLEQLLGRALASGGALRMLDHGRLRSLLLAQLLDPAALGSEALAPVRDYLAAGAANDPERPYLLATRLAGSFLDYLRERPEPVERWLAGEVGFPHDPASDAWQRALFLRVFGPQGALEALEQESGERWRAWGQLSAEPGWSEELDLPDPLCVVACEPLGRARRELLLTLAAKREVRLFRYRPCVGFRDDLAGAFDLADVRARLPRRSDAPLPPPEAQESVREQALLPVLGLLGLEDDQALAQRASERGVELEVEARYGPPPGEGLLGRLQEDLLLRAPAPGASLDLDESLAATACVSRPAEVERAAEVVLARLVEDDAGGSGRPLQLHEIALLVPRDLDGYWPLIRSVFGTAGPRARLIEGRPDERLLEVCELLLDLPGGRFSRQELLGVVTHPSVLTRAELDRAEVQEWFDALGLYLGADRSDQAGTYLQELDEEHYTIQAALRRLTLGAFCEGERSGEGRLVSLGVGDVPPEDLPAEKRAAAARFSLLLRSLVRDAAVAEQIQLALREWGRWFEALIRTYLAPSDEREETLHERLARALGRLGESDLGGAPVAYAVAAAAAREVVSGLRSGYARDLAGGVLVASRLPPLPLRQVVVLGLDETFPVAAPHGGELDLRRERAPGEDSPRALELDALLGTLASAERVHLTYVAKDARGRDQVPSPVIGHLRRVLGSGYLTPEAALGWLVRQGPLRHDPADFPALAGGAPALSKLPDARREAQCVALREDLRAHLGIEQGPSPGLEQVRAHVRPAVRRGLDALLGLGADPGTPTLGAEPLSLSVSQLKRFLQSPVQQGARWRGLAEAAGIEPREAEPFEVDRLDEWALLTEVFRDAMADPPAEEAERRARLLERYEQVLRREERRGRRVPTGPFLEVVQRKQREVLTSWDAALPEPVQPLIALRFGQLAGASGRERVEAPIALEVPLSGPAGEERVRVEIAGSLPLLLADLSGSVTPSTSSRKKEEKLITDGFLSHVLLAASGVRCSEAFSAHLLRPKPGFGWKPVELGPLEQEAARDYLRTLVADLLLGQRALFPLEAVVAHLKRPERGLPARIQGLRRDPDTTANASYGPLRDWRERPVPSDSACQDLLERRFGLYQALKG